MVNVLDEGDNLNGSPRRAPLECCSFVAKLDNIIIL
jgi:hypothetical protein